MTRLQVLEDEDIDALRQNLGDVFPFELDDSEFVAVEMQVEIPHKQNLALDPFV